MEPLTIIIIVILGLIGLYVIVIFNTLVLFKHRVANAFSQIDVQLKRRYDLIPNLIAAAKAYLNYERDTLEAVTKARKLAAQGLQLAQADPTNADAIKQLSSAESGLVSALDRFRMVVEAYPDLKADQNMIQLSEEISSTENRVAFARQAFNDQVMVYNVYKQSFPQILLAGVFGHAPDASLLEFKDSKQIQNPPKVLM